MAGNLNNDPDGMAKIMSDQYESAFIVPAAVSLDFGTTPADRIEDISFTENDIVQAIDEVRNNSAPGPDRFPAVLLKNCKNELAKPLCLLWRHSLDTGEVPHKLSVQYNSNPQGGK